MELQLLSPCSLHGVNRNNFIFTFTFSVKRLIQTSVHLLARRSHMPLCAIFVDKKNFWGFTSRFTGRSQKNCRTGRLAKFWRISLYVTTPSSPAEAPASILLAWVIVRPQKWQNWPFLEWIIHTCRTLDTKEKRELLFVRANKIALRGICIMSHGTIYVAARRIWCNDKLVQQNKSKSVECLQSNCVIKDNKMEVLLHNKHINHELSTSDCIVENVIK